MKNRISQIFLVFGLLLIAGIGGKVLPAVAQGFSPEPVAGMDQTIIEYVATDGFDSEDCTNPANPCKTIQHALNLSTSGDEIRVAAGTYTEPDGTVVTLKKGINLSGGWRADFGERNPTLYTSTLDAQGIGAVIRILGAIAPTIDGFTITGGDASHNTDDPGKGGGIYSKDASPIIVNNIVSGNLGYSSTEVDGYGGGIYLENASTYASINANQVYSNTASTGYIGRGGGIYLENSSATIEGNAVYGNVALAIPGRSGQLDTLEYRFAPLDEDRQIQPQATPPPVEDEQSRGGGIGVYGGAPIITGNHVYNNITSLSESGGGGGIYAMDSSVTISNNVVEFNLSSAVDNGVGGGIAVYSSEEPVVTGNIVHDNIASQALVGKGGGIALKWIWDATVSDNIVYDDLGTTTWYGHGGGIFVKYSYNSVLNNNTVYSNTASLVEEGQGGGIFTRYGDITLQENHVYSNTASLTGMGQGGGIFSAEGMVTMTLNLVENNIGTISGTGYGGAVFMWDETAMLDSNTFRMNNPSLSGHGYGGGIYITNCYPSLLINNIIARNQANTEGGGVGIYGMTLHTQVTLINNTIADNLPGTGEGVYLKWDSEVSLTNNIVTGHTYGIYAHNSESSATASYTLFDGNINDTGGSGAINNQNPVYGDPAYVDHPNGDYHIGAESAAVDAGDPAGVPPAPELDMDGETRPMGDAVDIGADETPAALPAMHIEDIRLQYRAASQRLIAKVTIVDADGQPVPEANVVVEWTLPDSATRTQQRPTDANGLSLFRIRALISGTYTLTVSNVEKEGWFYDADANNKTSASIVVP